VNHINEFESLDKCCDYLEAYYDFFTKGYEWMQDVMPRVHKYREYIGNHSNSFMLYIAAAKKDHEKVQAERAESMDEHGRPKVPFIFPLLPPYTLASSIWSSFR
jgi:hypothetical protein